MNTDKTQPNLSSLLIRVYPCSSVANRFCFLILPTVAWVATEVGFSISCAGLPGRCREYLGSSFEPFGRRNPAAFDDRPHGAKRQNATAMAGNNDLLRGDRIPPFLMTPGLSHLQKAAMPQDSNHLIRCEARRAAITQPSPRPVSRFPVGEDRRAPDIAESLPGCSRGLPPRWRRQTRNRGVRGTLPSSHRSRDHIPEPL